MDKNCLTYWYPKLVAGEIPTPRTTWVETSCQLIYLLDAAEKGSDEKPAGYEDFLEELDEAARRMGYPIFLRTGVFSGKHEWDRTCFVQDPSKLGDHILNIVNLSEIVSFIGLAYNVWVVREFLDLNICGFLPAYDNMPLAREFRTFVSGGEIKCIHPYWPRKSVEQGEPADPEMFLSLEKFSEMGEDEAKIRDLVGRVAVIFNGDGGWSVDVCQTSEGHWLVTDMAIDHESYHWEDCVNNPQPVDRYDEQCRTNAVAAMEIDVNEVLQLDPDVTRESLLQEPILLRPTEQKPFSPEMIEQAIEYLRKPPESREEAIGVRNCPACGMG